MLTTDSPAPSRRRARAHEARRSALVDSALRTLSELGYANTSVRDIAQNSEFSHGVLHYYFADKAELIEECIHRIEQMTADRVAEMPTTASSASEYADAVATVLADSLRTETADHRLWYDLRSQSMFDDQLREAAGSIDRSRGVQAWTIVERYAAIADRSPAVSPAVAYQVIDGVFFHHVLAMVYGDETSPDRLRAATAEALEALVPVC